MSTDDRDVLTANVRIALLGPPLALVPGGSLVLPRRQTRALFSYLAATSSPAPRGQLCALFWPDIPESEARRNLTHLLTLLRKALPTPAAVIAGPEDVALDSCLVWSDVWAFTQLTATTEPARRRAALWEAVGLWRGPFLDGFDAGGSDVFEEWVAQQRAWWERRYLDALAGLIDIETARGAYPAAIELAQRYLAVDDLAEETHRQIMRLYAATGDRVAALRQFERCREVLAQELGIPPLAETRALYDDLLAGRSLIGNHPLPAVSPPALSDSHTRLPAPVDLLIGREAAVAEIVQSLLRPEIRLLTLTGPGGVGKTRLALAAAAAAEPAFADGVVFVPLVPVRDPALVPMAIFQGLGLREAAGSPLLDLLGQALRERHLLLVLDNIEHLLPAAPIITDLLAAVPSLTVLVTSRVLLRLSGEHAVTVPPLAVPDLAALPPPERLAEDAAVALFLDRARALDPGFTLSPANAADLAVICARLDGLPLALELAAARLRVLTPAQLLARLDQRLMLLTDGPRDLPPRQQTLRATLDWSFALLNLGERLLLGRLSVFSGGFSLEAAEWVMGDGEWVIGERPSPPAPLPMRERGEHDPIPHHPSPIVFDSVASLVDNSLLQRVRGMDGEPRFAMLEVVREYALERLVDAGDASMACGAHAAYFLALAERAGSSLDGPEQVSWLDRLEEEHANVGVALEWLLTAGDLTGAARLAGALYEFWHLRGYLTEGRAWLERIMSHEETEPGPDGRLPPRVAALARFAAGRLALDQGDLAAAADHLDRSVDLWRALDSAANGERQARRFLIRSLGLALQVDGMLGREQDMPALFAEIDDLARGHSDPVIDVELTIMRGRGLRERYGDLAGARAKLLSAQSIIQENGGPAHLAQQLRFDLGMNALWLGTAVEACEEFAAALTAASASRDRGFEALVHLNLGEANRLAGNDVDAAAHYETSLRLYRALGVKTDIPRLIHNLGYLALHAGDLALARIRFRESLTGFQEVAITRGIVEAIAGLAAVAACAASAEAARTAGRLWGAVAAALVAEQMPIWPADQPEWTRYQALARDTLGPAAFEAALEIGRTLPLVTTLTQAHAV